jgi:1-acyl-sn-glycerol-3-phosphate acyltransferase
LLQRIKRALITVFCWHVVLNCAFASFVVGMPLAVLVPRSLDPDRRLPHRVGTFFWGWLVWMLNPFWRIEVEGAERLDEGGPYLICTNHQSLLDVLALMALGGDFKWVSGLRFFKIPMFADYMRATGYIAADLKNPFGAKAVLEECGRWLERGVSIGLFPEGTRSKDGELGSFKPGAFRVAIERDLPVLPVVIDGTRDILPRGSWSYTGDSPYKVVRVKVLPPVHLDTLETRSPVALSRASRAVMAEGLDELRGRRTVVEPAARTAAPRARMSNS